MDIAQEMLMTFNDDSYLLKKVITGDGSHRYMAMTLKSKSNNSKGSVQQSQDRKKHVQGRFCTQFSSIAIALCIRNSCHKIVRSIRNTTLKLWADCAKEFMKNAQNYAKKKSWFLHHANAPACT